MEPRITLATLAVRDVAAARRFYDALGWATFFADRDVAFYDLSGTVLALFQRDAMAADAGVPVPQPGAVALAHNVRDRAQVARVLDEARRAGARIVKPARDTDWGGHSGYFADPDGHLWEVAWNPHWPLDGAGRLQPPRRTAD